MIIGASFDYRCEYSMHECMHIGFVHLGQQYEVRLYLKTALLTVLGDNALVRLVDADAKEANYVIVLKVAHLQRKNQFKNLKKIFLSGHTSSLIRANFTSLYI